MKNTCMLLLAALISICLNSGCKSDDIINNGGGNNNIADTSILRTDEFGNILFGDTTDWCYNNPGGFNFYPAFPNPTQGNIVHLKFAVPASDTIKLYIKDSGGRDHVYMNTHVNPGVYTVSVKDTTGEFRNTFQRAFISSVKIQPPAYCRFYGDIKFDGY